MPGCIVIGLAVIGMDAAPIWRDEVPAVLLLWHVSLEYGNVLADGLPAEAQPHARLTAAWPSASWPAGRSGPAGSPTMAPGRPGSHCCLPHRYAAYNALKAFTAFSGGVSSP